MTSKTTAALALVFCSWTVESQAGFMPPSFAGIGPFDGKPPGFIMSERDRELCISPCFSMGARGYIAEFIFVARNDLADFSPRFFPGLLPDRFIYPVQKEKDISQHKDKHEDKHGDKHEDRGKGKDNFSGHSLPPPPPTAPQITETDIAPSHDDETLLITPEVNQVPVPATLALLGLGLTGLAWSRRRRA